jgi:hypothetical protein
MGVVAEISLIRNCTPTIMVLTNRVLLMAAVVAVVAVAVAVVVGGDTVVAPDLGVVALLTPKVIRASRSWFAT